MFVSALSMAGQWYTLLPTMVIWGCYKNFWRDSTVKQTKEIRCLFGDTGHLLELHAREHACVHTKTQARTHTPAHTPAHAHTHTHTHTHTHMLTQTQAHADEHSTDLT